VRLQRALGILLAVGGVSVATVGMSARAEAPRVEARLVAQPASTEPDPGPLAVAQPRSVPTTIEIPSIDVRAAIGSVGLAPDGSIEVPEPGPRYGDAAWYRYSPTPGERGPSVVEGHLDTADGSPSVFYRLAELAPGSQVRIGRTDGSTLTFTVTEVARFTKATFPTHAVYGDLDHSGLRLLTCGGPLDADGQYRDNVVVFATLTGSG
jgi:sortase (surface protein transpeptidase)